MNAASLRKALPPPPLQAIETALERNNLEMDWLAGDGSDRCYYRIYDKTNQDSFVLMQLSGSDAEALKVNGYDWITIGVILTSYQIRTPKLYATLPEYAALIIEDYGNQMLETTVHELHSRSNPLEISKLYLDTFDVLCAFLKIPPNKDSVWCKRAFDSERFIWEMDFFQKNFLEPVARITLSEKESYQFKTDIKTLSEYLSESSKYFCHRDFHSRNIMLHENKIAVIDFQDARLGPPSYDLVSLVFDSYVPFKLSQRKRLIEEFCFKLNNTNLSAVASEISTQWPAMLLQRQLKAIGSFGYLTQVKNRGDYLKYVPAALECLDQKIVFDKRWPLLSGELLERMRTQCGL